MRVRRLGLIRRLTARPDAGRNGLFAEPHSPRSRARPVEVSRARFIRAHREELFTVERLESHARSLAVAQTVTRKPTKGYPVARPLAENAAALLQAYRKIAQSTDDGRAITPTAQCLVDNYNFIEKQIREIRSDLSSGNYTQLPELAHGPFAGYPRVFGLAWAFIAHTDSRFAPDLLFRYVRAYQEVEPLTIAELGPSLSRCGWYSSRTSGGW